MSYRSRALPPLRAAVAALVVASVALACGETATQVGEADVASLRVTPDSGRVATGGTLQMRAFPLDASEAFLPGVSVTWSTSDPSRATIDGAGLLTGVSNGSVEVTAAAAGLTTVAVVSVEPPPVIVPDADTVAFAMEAGGADPAPDSVGITNGGSFPLEGLAVDTILYTGAAEGWLTAELTAAGAPSVLALTPLTGGLTAAGTLTATVRLTGDQAAPVELTAVLNVGPAAAASVDVTSGDGQSAVAGTAVPVPPGVRVTDAFGNPVPSIQVTFAVTGGGGSVSGATAATGADGVATVGSWTLGQSAGPNQLTATPAGLTGVSVSATGVPGAATVLEINAGEGQAAVAGSAVAVPPSVIARDQFGNGVPGVAVGFAVASGGGSVTGPTQTTDASGVATVGSWVLGVTAGPNTLEASSGAVPGTVTINATGISGSAVAIQLEGGDAQTDTVAASLAPYAVKVVDSNGNGVEGVTVSWGVTGGGGSIPSTSVTGADGVATAVRVLGQTAGVQTTDGGVGGLQGSPVQFTATAVPGAPFTLANVAGGGQSATVGTAVATPPRVRLQDQFGNVIAARAIAFDVTAGGGSVAADTVDTDAGGESSVAWTLGTSAGTNNNTLQALAVGTGVAAVSFTASAVPDAPASITGGTAYGEVITGQAVSGPPSVTVQDQYGNAVPGVQVNFTGDGTPSSAAQNTNAAGTATVAWTVDAADGTIQDDGTFPNQLTATVNGTAISTAFSADVIYSFSTHVYPLFDPAVEGCSAAGCHDVTTELSGLRLDGGPSVAYGELVGVTPVCDTFTGPVSRVSAAGGVSAADVNSLLMLFIDGALGGLPAGDSGACSGGFMTFDDAGNLQIVRAWIRNGAPNN